MRLSIRLRPDFPFFSRVMREGLFTGPPAKRPRGSLSGPIFSEAVDCIDLVKSP
jgi:hypothetical protein